MFGGICRETKKVFMVMVKDRSHETLKTMIFKYVAKGSTVYSDGWKGYIGLKNHGYQTRVINHKKHFVNPQNPEIHTQSVESLWNTFKRWLKSKGTKRCGQFDEYIEEFIFKKQSENCFIDMLKLIKEFYE